MLKRFWRDFLFSIVYKALADNEKVCSVDNAEL